MVGHGHEEVPAAAELVEAKAVIQDELNGGLEAPGGELGHFGVDLAVVREVVVEVAKENITRGKRVAAAALPLVPRVSGNTPLSEIHGFRGIWY